MGTLNGVTPVLQATAKHPDRAALIFPERAVMSFGQLEREAKRYQLALKAIGIGKGETVLLGEPPCPELYAFTLAALAQGTAVAVIEPWMPLSRIESVVEGLHPRLFLTGLLGRFWGVRSRSIRTIPYWMSLIGLRKKALIQPADSVGSLDVNYLEPNHLGLVAFTSGTTGLPKGVPRRHEYLIHQHRVLKEALHHDHHEKPELTIFANFVFANLASARGSVVIPSGWKAEHLRWAAELQGELAPETGTMGPAFLRKLVIEEGFSNIKSIHVGGALTDVAIFESAFGRFQDASFLHVYGSSEAEPVAVMDAKEAVQLSRQAGHFQTLALGRVIPQIELKSELSTTWVKGSHVCPMYIGKSENVAEENRFNKRLDEDGSVWHAMGDRVKLREGILWYGGRSSQSEPDFLKEQQLYQLADSSKLFLNRGPTGELELYCENLNDCLSGIRPEIETWRESTDLFRTTIVRDRRHRARIDRVKSKEKAKKVLRIEKMKPV
jgi:acyl-CoA synthetase (AMP-forming)/AMP-acid ligase II